MTNTTKPYSVLFDAATEKMLTQARLIDAARPSDIHVKYTLAKITYALRTMYQDDRLRKQFVGALSEGSWSKGFCGLASKAIYELNGRDTAWDLMAVKITDWSLGPVIFVRDKITGTSFGTTGEHFAPIEIPYELGMMVLDPVRFKTPNSTEFIQILESKLSRE